MNRIKPPALKKDGTILVIGPSSYPPYPTMRLSEGVEYLRKRGFKVILGKTLRNAVRHRFYSATDQLRADELNEAFRRQDVDAIFCARGGVGSLRILDLLDYDAVRDNPKVFVGYSDITAFQIAFLEKVGLVTFQGPMPAVHHEGAKEEIEAIREHNWNLLFDIIVEGKSPEIANPPNTPAIKTIHGGRVRGILTGGNIIIFSLMTGSKYDPRTDGKILFLENIQEDPWRLDDYLSSLALSGKLQAAKGLLFGEFPEPEQFKSPSPSVEEVIVESIARFPPKPSMMNLACCHGRYVLTQPIGCEVELDADEQKVTLMETAVAK